MDKKEVFVERLQKEIQQNIINLIKARPQFSESDLHSISTMQIPIDQMIKDQKIQNLQEIRTLNQLKSQNGELVELTYMIQSTFNPEVYAIAAVDMDQIQQYKQQNNNLNEQNNNQLQNAIDIFQYHDNITLHTLNNNNSDEFNENISSALADRSIYYAIPIPNVNSWVNHNNNKQSMELEQQQQQSEEIKTTNQEQQNIHTLTYKGIHINMNSDLNEYGNELQKLGIFNYENKNQQYSYPCLLKYYQNQEQIQYPKLNQIVKVIGILSYDSHDHNNHEDQMEMENNNHNHKSQEEEEEELFESFDRTSFIYPERLIPRIHVLKSQIITYDEIKNDLLLSINKTINNDNQNQQQQQNLEQQRQIMLQGLTKILGEDNLASFYMLMSLISSVNLTKDEKNYGNIFLNLIGAEQKLGSGAKISETLNDFITSILPYTLSIPLSLSYLNNANITPITNSTGQFVYGQMQLPKSTKHYIICDETNMEQGHIDAKGLSNAKNLIALFEDLKIPIETEFFRGSIDADISGVILSEGKGMLYKDIQIRLQEDKTSGEQYPDQKFTMDMIDNEEQLNNLREYLIRCKYQALSVQLDQDVATNIQNDFVEMRKTQAKNIHNIKQEEQINQDSLERWIHLCRLNAASKLKQYATLNDYLEIKNYESNRIQRAMKIYNKNNNTA